MLSTWQFGLNEELLYLLYNHHKIMATRSRIAMENPDGTVTSVYCHWDGYPEGNGKILLEHYNDPEKLKELLALGDISALRPQVSPDFSEEHTFDNPYPDVTVAYHRDRQDDFSQQKHSSRKDYFDENIEEYGYLFTREGEWLVTEHCEAPVPLFEVLPKHLRK